MKSVRYLLVLSAGIAWLFLNTGAAFGQLPTPTSYAFVEVRDKTAPAIGGASITISLPDGSPLSSATTATNGKAGILIRQWMNNHHLDLQVSKPGYLPYDDVLFSYPVADQGYRYRLSNRFLDGKDSEAVSTVVLFKTPESETERLTAEREKPKTQLLLAVKKGDVAAVRKLLEAGVDAKATDANGVPAIVWAGISGDGEIIKALLAAKADVRKPGALEHQALLVYLSEGIFRDHFLRISRNSKDTNEMIIAQRDEVVRRFIEAGAALNTQDSRRDTVLNNAIQLTDHYRTYLSVNSIKALLAGGASPTGANETGWTPLMAASWFYKPDELVSMLIEAGAGRSVNAQDKEGRSALMLASETGRLEKVKTLMRAGAAVNAKDNKGRTPLMHVLMFGRPDLSTLLFLISSGANVNASDLNGKTVLSFAREVKSEEAAKILLDAGATN